MHTRHAVLGLPYRVTMQVCNSNIEQSVLLSSVRAGETASVEEKRW